MCLSRRVGMDAEKTVVWSQQHTGMFGWQRARRRRDKKMGEGGYASCLCFAHPVIVP